MELTKEIFDDLLDDLDEFRMELLKGRRCGFYGRTVERKRMTREQLAERLNEIRTKITDLEAKAKEIESNG